MEIHTLNRHLLASSDLSTILDSKAAKPMTKDCPLYASGHHTICNISIFSLLNLMVSPTVFPNNIIPIGVFMEMQ